jgi:hypothetical protein
MELDGSVWQFTANALENGPSGGGGGGLDAAGVRAAIGLASANLDAQLADLPTVAEFNARSLPSADYFVVSDYTAPPTSTENATAVWAAATRTITGGTITTVSDKTGYSLTQAFPANFAALVINASGHVSRVTLVDTTTTNTDMRGTNNALLAASYMAPPSVVAIRTEIDTNSTKLDVAVGTRLASASYTAPPTAIANATAVRSELATELSRIDTTVSSRLAGASYAAPDNAGIAAIKAKTDSLTFTVAGFVDCNLYRWRGTQPGNLDANSFVPANVTAINGGTARETSLATALDGNWLAKLNVSGVLAHTDNATDRKSVV